MEAPQQNFISRVANQARLLRDSQALSNECDVLYNGTADYDTLITQEQINSVASFANAGLTKTDLDAVVYILKMVNV